MFDSKDENGPKRVPRPRDAATLIIVRRDRPKPEVLMGQRHESHSFMPNKFVFPGGRVDLADTKLKSPTGLRPGVAQRLARASPAGRGQALALAAIRETYEETGLRIAHERASGLASRSPAWRAFSEGRFIPALDHLEFVFRAITPPFRHRRYDTRFFQADAEALAADGCDMANASGELLKLHWVRLDDAQALDLPNITRVVLKRLAERLAAPDPDLHPIPFTFFRRGKTVVEHL